MGIRSRLAATSCCVVWLGVGVGAASAQPVAAAEPVNVVTLAASGQVEVQQDWLSLSLATTREGLDAAGVQAQLKQALEQAMAEVRTGVQPGQMEMRSGGFNLHPRYGKEGRIAGWTGSAELILEGRDVARIGAAAGRVQSMAVSAVQFSLSREARAAVETQAQTQAVERFKQRAQELAKGFGFTGYTLREVQVSGDDPLNRPMPRLLATPMRAGLAEAPVPLESGRALVQVTISGAVQLK